MFKVAHDRCQPSVTPMRLLLEAYESSKKSASHARGTAGGSTPAIVAWSTGVDHVGIVFHFFQINNKIDAIFAPLLLIVLYMALF